MAKTTLARRLRRLHLQPGYEPDKRTEAVNTVVSVYRSQRKAAKAGTR